VKSFLENIRKTYGGLSGSPKHSENKQSYFHYDVSMNMLFTFLMNGSTVYYAVKK